MNPRIYPESGTTLPEDRFYVDPDTTMIYCVECRARVTDIDPGNDLNSLVRLSGYHLAECTAG
jgi:hypothetical protein